MRAARPDLIFIAVFILGIIAAWSADFYAVSANTFLLVGGLAALFVLLRRGVAGLVHHRVRKQPPVVAAMLPIWVACLVILGGALYIVNFRFTQATGYLTLQDLRMALISGEISPLPFPLSNVQSLGNALGITLYACTHFYAFTSHRQKQAILAASAILLTCSAGVALVEANRASVAIIVLQVLAIRTIAYRPPSLKSLVVIGGILGCAFLVSQILIRQKADVSGFDRALDFGAKNVASYMGGGIVAFDRISNGYESAPPYRFAVTGTFAEIFLGYRPDEDLAVPFVSVSDEVNCNVYSALFYLDLHEHVVLGLMAFTFIVILGCLVTAAGNRSLIGLLVSSYFLVAVTLWPFSEYLISLLPLLAREIFLAFCVKLIISRKRYAGDMTFKHAVVN